MTPFLALIAASVVLTGARILAIQALMGLFF